jgi:hypothetical protein
VEPPDHRGHKELPGANFTVFGAPEVIHDGGFTQVRRAFAGPFNMVLEAGA